MTTYTEYMLKKAGDEKPTPPRWTTYQQIADAAKNDSAEAQKVLDSGSSATTGWGLLGAGLGAGGGYLISRWLRRNGTKRQRALDMLIGALIGGGGTIAALKNIKGKEGLTLEQQAAFDEYLREHGYTGKSREDIPEKGSFLAPNKWNVSMGAGGAILGATGGAIAGPFDDKLGVRFTNRAEKHYAGKPQKVIDAAMDRAATRGTRIGGAINTLGGGLLGGSLGYGAGSAINYFWPTPYANEGTA